MSEQHRHRCARVSHCAFIHRNQTNSWVLFMLYRSSISSDYFQLEPLTFLSVYTRWASLWRSRNGKIQRTMQAEATLLGDLSTCSTSACARLLDKIGPRPASSAPARRIFCGCCATSSCLCGGRISLNLVARVLMVWFRVRSEACVTCLDVFALISSTFSTPSVAVTPSCEEFRELLDQRSRVWRRRINSEFPYSGEPSRNKACINQGWWREVARLYTSLEFNNVASRASP